MFHQNPSFVSISELSACESDLKFICGLCSTKSAEGVQIEKKEKTKNDQVSFENGGKIV